MLRLWSVVYFDHFLVTARTPKLVKILFSTVFKLCCSFYSFFSKKSTEKDKFQVPPQGVAKIEKKLALRVSWAVWGKTVRGSTLSLDPFWLPPIGSKFWRFLLVLCSCCWCCCWGWCGCWRHVFIFQKWNQRKSFKINKKVETVQKEYSNQLLVVHSTQKLVKVHNSEQSCFSFSIEWHLYLAIILFNLPSFSGLICLVIQLLEWDKADPR